MQVHELAFKHHKNAPYFFKDFSFQLEKGKIHALHGKNGVGKTVLFHLLTKRIPPQAVMAGKITGGENVALVNQRFEQMIADQFSFQENLKFARINLFPKFFSCLQEPYFYPNFLKEFHIDLFKPAGKLSGGQKQILALLMVLQKNRNVLLLDEPTATLDEQNAILVFDFLKTLAIQQNITLFVVCHDRELINHYTNGNHFYLEVNAEGLRKLNIQ